MAVQQALAGMCTGNFSLPKDFSIWSIFQSAKGTQRIYESTCRASLVLSSDLTKLLYYCDSSEFLVPGPCHLHLRAALEQCSRRKSALWGLQPYSSLQLPCRINPPEKDGNGQDHCYSIHTRQQQAQENSARAEVQCPPFPAFSFLHGVRQADPVRVGLTSFSTHFTCCALERRQEEKPDGQDSHAKHPQ